MAQGPADTDADDDTPDQFAVSHREVDEVARTAMQGKRMQRTFYVSEEVVARLNAAVYWAPGYAFSRQEQDGVDLNDAIPESASAMVETGMWAEVLRVERAVNHGRPFPPVRGKLRSGPVPRSQKRDRGGE